MLSRIFPVLLAFTLLFEQALSAKDGLPGLPAPLTDENFDEVLSHGLHLVEFFSPYCSHCKEFAPTWEKTWHQFREESVKLGIGMSQVDCVTSGDLCQKHKIKSFPSLKLYGPKGFIRDYPRKRKRKLEDLIGFMTEAAMGDDSDEAGETFDESKSEYLTTDKMIKILADPIPKPMLISVWPSASLNEDFIKIDPSKFDTPFIEETIAFQKAWIKVSNLLEAKRVGTGHFNCLSNLKICNNLELNVKRPQVILILPKLTTGKVIKYNRDIYDLTAKSVMDEAIRMIEVSEFKDVTSAELLKSQKITAAFQEIKDLPEIAETYFIYLYDPASTVKEDFQVLPYLKDTLADLPNAYLYKSNDTKFLELAKAQSQNVFKFFDNYEMELDFSKEFNEQRHTVEFSSTLPTLLAFKQYGLVPSIYHSYQPNHIRDQWVLNDFLKEQGHPYITQFTRKTFKRLMEKDTRFNSGKLAILVIEDDGGKEMAKTFNSFLVGYQAYLEERNEERFQQVLKDRNEKMNKVSQLKEAMADSKKIIKALSKEVHYKKGGELQACYITTDQIELLNDLGFNIDEKKYSSGDVLIAEKQGKFYYDSNMYGDTLSVRKGGNEFVDTMLVLEGLKEGKIAKRLRNSPYSPMLRGFDHLHQFGVFGYFVVLGLVGLMFSKIGKRFRFFSRTKSLVRPHNAEKHKGLGILDGAEKFD